MKLTKELEAEVLKVYKAYWEAYLNGDMKTFASMLDDDITVFGTAVSEVFNNKKETLRFYKATADQLVGKAQFRNRKINVNEVDDNVLVNEQCDLYFLMDKKWTFYGHTRISAIFKHTKTGWKLIHQHASFPDIRAEEGEQIAAEKIKAENLQLRDAVKRRTIELEEKNRELEIETSLEKVRAQALGMHKADELLSVCKVLFKELIALGFTGLRNAIIHSFNDDKAYFTDYDYSDTTGGAITNISYNENPIIKKFIKQIRKSDNAFVQINIKGNELKNWKRFRKKGGQPDDPLLNKASAIHYYLHSIEKASIGISTFNVINKEQLRLLKRFRNVFDFAYRRYMDIAQAEAQTREAQIEVAVERVRAKALAMHRSDEIHEVVRTLRNELFGLKLEGIIGATICLKQSDGQIRFWDITDAETTGRYGWEIVFDISKIDPRLWVKKIWDSKNQIISTEQDLSDLKRALKWLSKYDKKTADEVLKLLKLNNINHGWHRAVRLAHGRLITDFANEPPSEIDPILLKIGVAFDLAYRRFLDLQKAEAQAKEARIELALEKVRTRAMAMQNSTELGELVSTVFNELNHLDFALTSCIIWIHDHDLSSDTLWIASSEMNRAAEPYEVRPFHKDFFQSIIPAWKAKDPKWVFTLTGAEKRNFEKAFFEELPDLPDALRKALKGPKQVVFSASFNNFGALEIVETKALTDEKFDILHRFGKVFDSSYTRFNDLKKAEAQAREAKIEASLERVRAKTMAMHKSSDLLDVVKVLGEQFELLGFKFQSVNFDTDFQEKDWNLWLYNVGSAMYPGKIHIPYIDHPCFNRPLDAFKKGGDLHSFIFTKEEKDSLFDHIYANSVAKYGSDERKRFTYAAPGFALSIAVTKNTRITIANYYAEPFSKEENAILRRFANVFEQSYTRFLDLQKAEAQAREAEIELALERVRARTMAMQKSDELREAVLVIYQQLNLLHFEASACNIIIIDRESNSAQYWVSGFSQETFPVSYTVPYFNHPYQDALLKPWKQGAKYVVYEYAGKMKQNFDEIFFTQTDFKNVPAAAKNVMIGIKSVMLSTAFMTYGALQSLGAEPLSEENANILQRFAKVFEQTYTRFLDLQKAEAQAREAQIEAALERVRSRTMAMQKTDELLDAAELVHKELAALGINSMNVSYAFVDEDEKYGSYYSINPVDGKIVPIPFVFPHTETEMMRSILSSWKKQESFNVIELKEKATLKHQTYIGEHIQQQLAKINVPFSIKEFLSVSPKKAVLSTFNFANGYLFNIGEERLSKIQEELMLRFTRVFEQTYTRFLDLQKAEAQAREAQIEAALERVRSRTMGMQKSEELKEVIQVVYDQFVHLNIRVEHTGFIMDYKKRADMHIWLADKHAVPFQVTIPYFDCAHWNSFKGAKEKGIDFFANQLSFEEKNKFYQDLFKLIPGVPEETLEYYFSCPGLAISTVLLENVGLYIENFAGIPYKDDENATLMRFGKVFQQTYTRFLDLQKAEAQAKESQIELGLERVRARAMAMQNSDELKELIGTVFTELTKLDLVLTRCVIMIYDGLENNSRWWMANSEDPKNPAGFFIKQHEHPPMVAYFKAWRERKIKYSYALQGKIKQDWDDFLFSETELKNLPGFVIEGMKAPDLVYLNASFNNFGNLTLASLEPLSDEHFDILLRFAKVFDLTYTRFNDLKQAEAQARESQIQLALERVRARTMAMQHSEELAETATVLFEQFNHLGEVPERIAIGIINEEEHVFDIWATQHGGTQMNLLLKLSLDEPHVMKKMYQAWREQKKFITIDLQGNELEEYFQFLKKSGASVQREIFGDRRIENVATFSKGVLMIITTEPRHAEVNKILERFAGVFDQTYTRFLDLQKAEAQAKEAQIEAALEKVRARTMGMQKSDELAEVVGLLFKQFEQLDFGLYQLLISIYDTRNNIIEWWSKGFGDVELPQRNIIPIIDHPFPNILLEKWKSGTEYYAHTLEGKLKNSWEDYLFTQTDLKYFPQEVKDAMKSLDKVYLSDVFIKYGSIQAAGPMPLPDDKASVLKRFAKVLDLAYTRMTDLQNAEAQAKEAKIEAALERVRSRSLAMHSPEELKGVALELRNQLGLLEQPELEVCAIQLYEESPDYFEAWGAVRPPGDEGKIIQVQVQFPKKGIKIVDEMFQQYESGAQDYVLLNEGEKVPEWLNVLKERVPEGYEMVIQSLQGRRPEDTRAYWSMADFKGGSLVMTTYIPPSDDARKLLRRFANVFGLAYRRFIDLKNAEIQKREAQIELALERVRARTMAMHRSEELAETAQVLFHQLQELGGIPDRIAIGVVDETDGVVNFWTTDQLGSHIDKSFKARINERTVISKTYQGWKDNKRSLIIDLHGDDVREWIQFAREEMGIAVKDEFIKDRRAHNLAFFSHGWLHVTSHEPQSAETIQILERFASVFNLTYRRFLDLEKAEAQARESELELALERVRAKSMSMRHSDELADLVKIVFKELTRIGFSVNACIIMTYDERTNDSTWWISNFDGVSNPVGLFVPNHSNEPYLAYLNEWKKQTTKWRYKLGGVEKKKWDQYIFKNSGLATLPDPVKTAMQSAEETYLNVCFNKYASITFGSFDPMSDKDFDTLHRFAKVFEQSYTRFLDLQKAEAQVREAQIETALERVRARTMGMHQSKELHDVIETVTTQLLALGLKFDNSVFCRVHEDESWEMWMSTPQQSYPSIIYVPYIDHRIFNNLKEVKAKNLEFYTDVFEQDEAMVFFKHFFENTIAKDVPEERKQYVLSSRGMARSLFLTKDIWFVISRYSPDPFNDEENAVLKRFAKVFEQSYIRFLDLEKAEAQANEARIEIALERIRARALAMHKSDELMEVAKVLWEQMALLGQPELEASVVHLYEQDPDHIHSWRAVSIGTESNTKLTYGHMAIPKHSCEFVREWLASFYSDLKEYTIEISGAKQEEWYDMLFQLAPDVVNSMRDKKSIHEKRFYRFSKFSGGALLMVSKQEPSEKVTYLQKRAAVVFDLAYRRFSDLQKAEAQAREAQIEASLERVRSKTMAMHDSQDVGETVATMFDELVKLGIETMRCGIGIMHDEYQMELWTARPDDRGKVDLIVGRLDMRLHPLLTGGYQSWKDKKDGFSYELKDDDLIAYFNVINNYAGYAGKYDTTSLPSQIFHEEFHFNEGTLFAFSLHQLSAESSQICKRFAAVFGQTYRRYLDLLKAEAQAREAQIEASLERVRAKAMAMHSSKDLSETLTVFYRELKSLGVTPRRCGIALMDKEERMAEVTTMNTTEQGDSIEVIGQIRMSGHKILDDVYENWRKQTEYHVVLRGNEIKEYYQVLKPQMDFPDYPHDVVQYGYYFMFKEGDVYAWTENELTEDELKIYRRFTTVVSLTYKRYKDLQQAEAQAREAQIEAGLERVRARTMAMHSSDDVSIATATMFTELEKLGIENLRGGITIIKPDQTQEVWSITNLPDGRTIRAIGVFDMKLHPLWRALFKAKENKEDYDYYWLAGKEKEDYIAILNETPNYLAQPIKEIPDVHVQSYFFGEGGVWTNSLQPHSEDDKQIMKKFASVFSLTFRRYQDLKKAEAQAREATIEAALERVRGKAMAMHSSKDLADTIGVFYNELSGLSLTPRRCGVGLINKESRIAEISTMNSTSDGQGIELVGKLDMTGHPVLVGVYENWLTKTEYHPVLRGNEIKEYYQFVRPQIDFPAYPDDSVQYGYFFFFEEGGVYAWTEKELHDDELKIYRRFTSVLSLTYKRYKDLKDAEARTQTAIRDAALDRIRADIASMRTINDLDRITPLIWNELTVLGIPFIRCGVFIMDDGQQLLHTFLSTPDGKAIAAFHLPYNASGHLRDVVDHWREKKNYISHWSQVDFLGIAETLVEQGAVATKEQYLSSLPRDGFYLHFLPFLQGMLYVGNTDQLKEEEIELIQHVADAFSTAYARYEDFNRLEAAKQQVEQTLTDLKQAQTQLVQSEKMASLGELTAGIAHEIQNPLNFVNNFSEVSKELLDEMKDELATGNRQQAMEIAEDIIQNLEKINHHGKRADAIVKSMLQHSRSSSGKKEPTDINALADEYLRLAYHGLRAKDKSFNAKFETGFDNSIGKINIISQDIGRVLVNLINNAFYAVSERKKQESNGYEPTVEVVTKKIEDKIEIKVKDNGNGIPKKLMDKIFQPFFTTKPTGQGTGLGLSLAYDIITKGHGGELKVETKEGEGSEFIIQLPTN